MTRLALLYNAKRAASIVCEEKAVLFALDRQTFTHIVKEASIKRRERFEQFLSRVEIFAELDAYEKGKLCDVLQTEQFEAGQAVVRQGDRGDKFYLIEEGEAVAKKKTESNRH